MLLASRVALILDFLGDHVTDMGGLPWPKMRQVIDIFGPEEWRLVLWTFRSDII